MKTKETTAWNSVKQKIRKEGVYIIVITVLLIGILKGVLYKENIMVFIKLVPSLMWLFVVPGFSLLYYWSDKLDFIERLIISVPVSAGIMGILSYNLGLVGLSISHHIWLPVPVIILVVFILRRQSST